ncbi:MAG: FtsX-like permease family protein, partial [Inconstantimicrobium porci]|uniref:FtsX-like permease family protein n=1 Tax=Inconstantimicrobium porci TaxID=2652291 RepID=UPI002A916A52
MYFKVAAKNVKKSFKDYSVYFLTLTLAVCIFYSFNSLSAQKVMFDLSKKGTAEVIETLSEGISDISILVSIILGGLILYANNFLIKRRNKEFGLYMMLGMSRSKISGILMCETIIVGILSLACGLIIGLVLSQVLSLVVVKLFDFDMTSYRFIFSLPAVGRTALYFGIMFILVMIFNILIISKYKIIDLLKSSVKNEKVRF